MKSEPLLMLHESHVFDDEDIEALAEFVAVQSRERLYAMLVDFQHLRDVATRHCSECGERFAVVVKLIELECARRLDS